MKNGSDQDPAPGPLRLRLLGGFELGRPGGEPLPPPSSKKARGLIAYLALSRRPASREKLAALLWPDSGEGQARGSLRQALSTLRRLLDDAEGEVLVAAGGELSLAAGGVSVDVWELEAAIAEGGRDALERAASLWAGPLLDGLDVREDPFDEWLMVERSRLRELFVSAMSRLLPLQLEAGALEAACRSATRLLAIAPLREEAHRALIDVHRRAGRWSDALEQFARCEARLRDELGVAPEAQTVALRDRVLRERDAAVGSGAGQGAVSGTTPRRSPLAPARDEGRPTIAVLPFDSLTEGVEHEHFADGVTEDITTELSRFPELFVIARNSAFAFKGRGATAEEVGRELAVQYLVTGSIRRAGSRVRLTAQLVETREGRHIWAQRYDRELADVFALQDELTRAIVGVLPGRVRDFEARRIARHPPENMAAYELLLVGRIHHHRFSSEDNRRALELLDRALELEPEYAAAWAWKACVLGQAVGRDFQPNPKQLWDTAVSCVNTGLSLDRNEVECHRILAEISIDVADLSTAERHNQRALELNPNDPRLVAQRGELLTWRGDARAAAESIELAMRLDPYGAGDFGHLLGRAYLHLGEHAHAIEAYRSSSYPRAYHHGDMAACHTALGDTERAQAAARRALELRPDFTVDGYVDALPYDREEDRERHRALLKAAPLP